jgi:hypothetical protein|tara:strand:+ start:692 stop:901 length:210 start_codon:yes stop_codon:yes gene_type:complete
MTPARMMHLREVTKRILLTSQSLNQLSQNIMAEYQTNEELNTLDQLIIRLQGQMIELDDAAQSLQGDPV